MTEKKKPGRKPGKTGRDVKVYLPDEVQEKARELGNGNLSKGLRIAVMGYKEPTLEEIYGRIIEERDRQLNKEQKS